VADQSSAAIQRRYFAVSLATRFPGFDQVEYPDWRSLLNRISTEAMHRRWRGPLIVDEFPYLAVTSPELPSVFQVWVDHEAKEAQLALALAGSSQRMMQGLVMEATEPLYGRATEAFHLQPLAAGYLSEALKLATAQDVILTYTAWGGVPRYWELMSESGLPLDRALDHLVLNPMGPLHEEPERLLLEELPPALALRPILDAIGLGAHRVSEIAARIGEPATSLSRPLQRLMELGLIQREIPFNAPSASGKRSLYKIADPFCRMWFRVVAPNRGFLADAPARARQKLWREARPGLVSATWEDLCRQWVSLGAAQHPAFRKKGDWEPARRFWQGEGPEWDVVSQTLDERCALLGEVKWSERPFDLPKLRVLAKALLTKGVPPVRGLRDKDLLHVVFVPEVTQDVSGEIDGVYVVTGDQVLSEMR
ncbi:MAG: helix-turn-helix domain-containing protein, partial [Desulfobacterales bacterium]|nr:helix-turn-helix domain-containing protein [Desulfobacterales bacterium]